MSVRITADFKYTVIYFQMFQGQKKKSKRKFLNYFKLNDNKRKYIKIYGLIKP